MKHDFVRDNNPTFLPVVIGALPDWAKDASVMLPDELAALSGSAFADPVRRLHPIHTKFAALMSGIYLASQGVLSTSPEGEAVKRACEIFGVWEDVERASELLSNTKSAAAEAIAPEAPSYALMVKEADVPGYYPITSAMQVQDSARALANDFAAGKIPTLWFKDASVAIMGAAARFGLDRDEVFGDVADAAEDRIIDIPRAHSLIEMRKFAGVPSDALGVYHQIVDALDREAGMVDTGVALIEQLDRSFGVKYAGVQKHPWLVIHCGPTLAEIEKAAHTNVVVSDVLVPAASFGKIDQNEISMRMGRDVAGLCLNAIKLASSAPAEASKIVGSLAPEVQRELLELAVMA